MGNEEWSKHCLIQYQLLIGLTVKSINWLTDRIWKARIGVVQECLPNAEGLMPKNEG